MNAAATKAWVVAATIGAVEGLKDQGICRWNYTLRSLHQHAKNNIGSFSQAGISSNSPQSSLPATVAAISSEMRNAKMAKRRDALEKAMDLSCWGPSTTRF
ncbi:hypothetical protein Tsubulata_039076 [Turnera subulata]|uniref:Wound-responsive family protein n=1 Tax=Turnera subulata TaxID=218843 RepID=A0A9Q0J7L2_9ROSI|nr:hypothetical protein Tsubulata_039076 [Turnera subulata]